MIARCCVLLFVATVVCGCGRRQQPGESPKPDRVRISYKAHLSYSPFIIAEEEGYYREQGIDAEIVGLSRSSYAIPALAQGEVDVLGGALQAALLNAIARGARIKIVADRIRVSSGESCYIAMLAKRSLIEKGTLEVADNLRGMRIAANRDNITTFFIHKALARRGVNLSDVEILTVPSPNRQEALESGKVDLVAHNEPWTARMLENGKSAVWVADHDIIPGYQFGYVAFGPSFLEERPDVGKRFMVAYLKAVRQFNQGKTERNLQILEKYTKVTRNILLKADWPHFQPDGGINVQSILDFQEWAVANKLVEKRMDPEDFWDPRFAEHAAASLAETAPSQLR